MNILLTGANGYIGKRLLPLLIKDGHKVICSVRDKARFHIAKSLKDLVEVVEADFLVPESLNSYPKDIDVAFYLVHSMSQGGDFEAKEYESAKNFKDALEKTNAKQCIYLSGISNDNNLSAHLNSRKKVENTLKSDVYALTTIRAGIIIGSGSASFEIIRDLVEKLPYMITPRWVLTKSQPIAVRDILAYLQQSINKKEVFNASFDVGGKNVMTYKEIMLQFAKQRGLKRRIYVFPVMTPRLSSYWLYFVTSTTYSLAVALVNSMKIEVIAQENEFTKHFNIDCLSYSESIEKAFIKIDQNEIVSSWKDAAISSTSNLQVSDFVNVPTHGCFIDKRSKEMQNVDESISRIWRIGGNTGWYYGTWLWKIRGFLDKLNGGVGLRRGRTNPLEINSGDSIDFWRVIFASKSEGRLLLYAEMKLPGEAWLEFKVEGDKLTQTATFRPKGLAGRLYWYSVLPFHGFIFKGMLKALVK